MNAGKPICNFNINSLPQVLISTKLVMHEFNFTARKMRITSKLRIYVIER
jgi:hypothetical protein